MVNDERNVSNIFRAPSYFCLFSIRVSCSTFNPLKICFIVAAKAARQASLEYSLIESSSDEEYSILQKKSKFCGDLRDLIDESLDKYRLYLKEQVQEDATNIFLNLTSDPSYVKLIINDNFGLNIVHESGQIIEVRSAGNEHVVALSLIGALHNNAPLQGPIVMDSPFGRLDSVHETNILSYLPKLANQVLLFVFDSEINEQRARNLLAGDLLQEFELCRGETFETTIRRK